MSKNETSQGSYRMKSGSRRAFYTHAERALGVDDKLEHMLSSDASDPELLKAGLSNHGLLGFVYLKEAKGTTELTCRKSCFSNGIDFLYTPNTEKKFTNQYTANLGVVGNIYTAPRPNTTRLHQFYNHARQRHLYVVNPSVELLLSKDYEDESNKHAMFICTHSVSGKHKPLYLYSNSKEKLFSPFVSDTISKATTDIHSKELVISVLEQLLDGYGFNRKDFSILHGTEHTFTLSLNGTWPHFYVNLDPFFGIVRSVPAPLGRLEHRLVALNDLRHGIVVNFQKWLIRVRQFQEAEPRGNSPNLVHELHAGHIHVAIPDTIHEAPQNTPMPDIELLADEIVSLLRKLRSEPGQMAGIVGRLGRGKTSLMDLVWKKIKNDDTEYIRVDYQAVRYQDTPASWAYLHEVLLEKYLGNKKKNLKQFILYYIKLWVLNLERNGKFSLILAFLFFALATFASFFIPLIRPAGLVDVLARLVGIPFLGVFVFFIFQNFRFDYLSRAFKLLKQYSTKNSFHASMGIQAEIQKELVHVINIWTKGQKRKILLVVDDLDRCAPAKTLEIIDSLRLILNDDQVKDKLTIMAAMDDEALHWALRKKYMSADGSYPSEDLVRDYLDNQFLFIVKLGDSTHDDAKELFEKLVHGTNNKNSQEATWATPPQSSADQPAMFTTEDKPPHEKISADDIANLLWASLKHVRNVAPRRISILYNRYQMANSILNRKCTNAYWMQKERHGIFIQLLMICSQDCYEIVRQRKLAEEEVTLFVELKDFKNLRVKRIEYLNLLKVLETVIPY